MPGNGLDYQGIKNLARELGRPVPSLLALANQNDPFYSGTPTDRAQAEWFRGVWEAAGVTRAHLRRMHYWCVSQGDLGLHSGEPYVNTDQCWKYLCQASKHARYLGLVPLADVTDAKNPDPHVNAYYDGEVNARFDVSVPDLTDPEVDIARRWTGGKYREGYNLCSVQPYHLEVWVEKSTMNDVLLPVCALRHANLVTGEGEMSITSVVDLVGRLREANKPTRLFYISDFDPAGNSMPRAVSRKLEWLLHHEGLGVEVKVCHLALQREHVERYALPRTPIKETERRGEAFEERYGVGAVELDALEALHPGVLAELVADTLKAFWSTAADAGAKAKERALRQAIRAELETVTERYAEQIEALADMRRELRSLTVPDLDQYEPIQALPGEVEGDDAGFAWLFNSDRTYLEQIEAYKGGR